MRFFIPLFTLIVLLLASMFGTVNAVEVHKNGFGGITPLNTTGLTVFNDSLKRSFDYVSDSMVLSAEFSILETDGDVRDFSLFDNDLTLQNATPSPAPQFVSSTFRTGLETINQAEFQINLTAMGDAYTRETNPTQNTGSATTFDVSSSTVSAREHGFVIWNVTGSLPAGANITSANVWLQHTSTALLWIEFANITSTWDESTVTWNTEPTAGNPVQFIQQAPSSPYWITLDITILAQEWQDGIAVQHGLRLRQCGTDGTGPDCAEETSFNLQSTFFSSEHGTPGNRPGLLITYTEVGGQWAEAPHSESLDMENTNVSMVWWGQTHGPGGSVTGKACSTNIYVYGIHLTSSNVISVLFGGSDCSPADIRTGVSLEMNRTYGIGVVFENNIWGTDVHFWLDGEWIYNETSTKTIGDTGSVYYVGRTNRLESVFFCDCTHDEVLVFKERLSNDTMKLLTTKQHDIVIRSGPRTTTQGFEGLFFALPWLIVFALIGWIFYLIAISWKEIFD